MALCEGALDAVHLINDDDDEGSSEQRPDLPRAAPLDLPIGVDYRSARSHFIPPEVEMYAQNTPSRPCPSTPARPSPASSTASLSTIESNASGVPAKRKRGRPRVDKTSPEYIAKSAARKQAREMAAMMNSSGELVEKRKRGRPRVDKTSPEYLARKRAKEIEALEKRAKRQYRRRGTGAKITGKVLVQNVRNLRVKPNVKTVRKPPPKRKALVGKITKTNRKINSTKVVIRRPNAKFVKRVRKKDSGASSSTGDGTPRVKRKYIKRVGSAGAVPEGDTPKKRGRKKKLILGPDGQPVEAPPSGEKYKTGKRGRPRKSDLIAAGLLPQSPNTANRPRIQVRNNLMPINSEPIPVDSDDEPNIGSPEGTSDLSLDENLRALRHIHEKYANIGKDELYDTHLLAANFKKPVNRDTVEYNSRDGLNNSRDGSNHSRDGYNHDKRENSKDLEPRIEKLEDSSGSSSGSSSSGSGSSSSESGSSSSESSSSSDSDSSDSESGPSRNGAKSVSPTPLPRDDYGSLGAWSKKTHSGSGTDSASESDPERSNPVPVPTAELSESENESPDKPFQCTICSKWYSTMVTLKIHKRSHLSRGNSSSNARRSRSRATDRYECDMCLQLFSRREKMLEHKAEAHRGSMTVRCDVCRLCFEDEAELAEHDRTHTPDERENRCSDCGSQFSRHEQLRRHRASAHPPPAPSRAPHACQQCGKAFTHPHSLQRHLLNHTKQLYRCVVCKTSFDHADQLAQHLNSHLATYRRMKN